MFACRSGEYWNQYLRFEIVFFRMPPGLLVRVSVCPTHPRYMGITTTTDMRVNILRKAKIFGINFFI